MPRIRTVIFLKTIKATLPMIDVKDLRIGNLINSPNGIITVTSIESEFKEVKEGECTVNDYNVSELEPIPLTAEILLKLGFVLTDDGISPFWRLRLSKCEVISIEDDWSFGLNADDEESNQGYASGDSLCEYLHQLQNLTNCLTGTELLINLNTK